MTEQKSKRRALSRAHKRRIAKALKGRTLSAEHKAHISQALKGRTFSLAHRDALSAARKGKPINYPKQRKPSTPEGNAKRREAMLERAQLVKEGMLPAHTVDLETRHKMSKALRLRWRGLSDAEKARIRQELINAALDRGMRNRLKRLDEQQGGEK